MDITIQNIPPSAIVDLKKWAEITIEKWQWNIVNKNLVRTGDLLRSFHFTVAQEADGNTAMISFAFNYYLKLLDMGVHKGVTYDNPNKRRHKIYSETAYSEIMRLLELLQQQYAVMGATAITNEFAHGGKTGATFKI